MTWRAGIIVAVSTYIWLATPIASQAGGFWRYGKSKDPGNPKSMAMATAIGNAQQQGALALICSNRDLIVTALPVPVGSAKQIEVGYQNDLASLDNIHWKVMPWRVDKSRLVLDGEGAKAFARDLLSTKEDFWLHIGTTDKKLFLVDDAQDRQAIAAVAKDCGL